jgi:TonB family protein
MYCYFMKQIKMILTFTIASLTLDANVSASQTEEMLLCKVTEDSARFWVPKTFLIYLPTSQDHSDAEIRISKGGVMSNAKWSKGWFQGPDEWKLFGLVKENEVRELLPSAQFDHWYELNINKSDLSFNIVLRVNAFGNWINKNLQISGNCETTFALTSDLFRVVEDKQSNLVKEPALEKKVHVAEAERLKDEVARRERAKQKVIDDAFRQAEIEAKAKADAQSKEDNAVALLNALASEKAAANVLDAMKTRIAQAWRRPDSFQSGMEVLLRMSIAPNGALAGVTVIKSSGDALFDGAATAAIQKAAPFNEVTQFSASTFEEKFRTVTVIFRPED